MHAGFTVIVAFAAAFRCVEREEASECVFLLECVLFLEFVLLPEFVLLLERVLLLGTAYCALLALRGSEARRANHWRDGLFFIYVFM